VAKFDDLRGWDSKKEKKERTRVKHNGLPRERMGDHTSFLVQDV